MGDTSTKIPILILRVLDTCVSRVLCKKNQNFDSSNAQAITWIFVIIHSNCPLKQYDEWWIDGRLWSEDTDGRLWSEDTEVTMKYIFWWWLWCLHVPLLWCDKYSESYQNILILSVKYLESYQIKITGIPHA